MKHKWQLDDPYSLEIDFAVNGRGLMYSIVIETVPKSTKEIDQQPTDQNCEERLRYQRDIRERSDSATVSFSHIAKGFISSFIFNIYVVPFCVYRHLTY